MLSYLLGEAHAESMSNHARCRRAVTVATMGTPPSLWRRVRSFLAWFFAPCPLPEAWTAPRIYGSRYPQVREDGAGLRQVLEESQAASDEDHNPRRL